MRILFAGSKSHLTIDQQRAFVRAGRALGREAARLHHEILVESDRDRTLDLHVAKGARPVLQHDGPTAAAIEVHQSRGRDPAFPSWTDVRRVDHPSDEQHKRLGARVGGLSGCDVAILMGGKRGTRQFGELAESMGKPVLAIPCFDGAAKELYRGHRAIDRPKPEWERLTPYLTSWRNGSARAAMRMAALLARAHSYFVSYSHLDLHAADHFELMLMRVGRVFRRDENELKPGASIERQLRSHIAASDTFLMLWSRQAAASKWCKWELSTAMKRMKAHGKPARIVFAQLDDADVPAPFRKNLHLDATTRERQVLAKQRLVDSEPLS